MKSFITILKTSLLIILPISIWISGSCSEEPRYKDFLTQVDSLKADIDGALVEIDIYGIISYNGCSRFSHCNTYVKDNDLIIEAWKTRDTEAFACPTVMVYLDQHITFDRDKLPDSFNIKVKQPDGSFLVKKMN
jgi:hypothetical protein